jgi:quercetin dioxygenase-like cupin family protein
MPTIPSPRSHTAVACLSAASAALVTYLAMTAVSSNGPTNILFQLAAHAQAPGQRTTDVLTQVLPELGREVRVRVTERDPGNGSTPHRHPGHHTFGFILEGTYEVRVGDGPVRRLNAGEAFYEPPGALHAISRNPSAEKKVRYLIFQVADPSKPATVPE